jgi:hypothetical protein
MSQFGIVFDTELTAQELQDQLDSDGVFKTLADKFGAYPYLIALSPAPPPAPTPPPGA